MAETIAQFIEPVRVALGLSVEAKDLTFVETSLRGILTFVAALLMVRLADRRFLAKHTAFDAILAFILASMLARAVNGSSAFFPTLGCGFVLVGLHRFLAHCGRVSHRFGFLVKGDFERLIENGRVNEHALSKNNLTRDDLTEGLRLSGNVEDPKLVKAAYLERNGQISVVR